MRFFMSTPESTTVTHTFWNPFVLPEALSNTIYGIPKTVKNDLTTGRKADVNLH